MGSSPDTADMFLNKTFVSRVNFQPPAQLGAGAGEAPSDAGSYTRVSRRQLVDHIKSDQFDSRQSPGTERGGGGGNENTYVSISDSMYQSLGHEAGAKHEKFPCPVLVCNLLASHADTFRHGSMTECRDCLDFAESLHDALPFLDPAVFKDIQKLQKLKRSRGVDRKRPENRAACSLTLVTLVLLLLTATIALLTIHLHSTMDTF